MSGLHVYAIAPADLALDWDVPGVGGESTRVLKEGRVAAVVHEVTAPIDPEAGEKEFQAAVLDHVRVVEAAWQSVGTVIPARFGTVVGRDGTASAAERLRAWLRAEESDLCARLDSLRARVELKVVATLDQKDVGDRTQEVKDLRQAIGEKPPGTRRLLQRKLAHRERRAALRLADAFYPEFRRGLSALVEDILEEQRPPAPNGAVSLFAGAILLPEDQIESVGAYLATRQEEERALHIRFLGPWPPYTFAGQDLLQQAIWPRSGPSRAREGSPGAPPGA